MIRGSTAFVLVAFLARAALAAGGAHHHDEGIPWGKLAFSAINLGIFLWVLARFVWPGVRRWVEDRRTRIMSELDAAAEAKAEAMRLKAEWEERLARLDQTIQEMRAQAQVDIERERERILSTAQHTAETIRRDAERAAAYKVRRTQEQLRAEMVRQALRTAEDTLRTQWTADDQARFVNDFVKQVQS